MASLLKLTYETPGYAGWAEQFKVAEEQRPHPGWGLACRQGKKPGEDAVETSFAFTRALFLA